MFGDNKSAGLDYVQSQMTQQHPFDDKKSYRYYSMGFVNTIHLNELWGILLYCYAILIGCTKDTKPDNDHFGKILEEFVLRFWNLLNIIN